MGIVNINSNLINSSAMQPAPCPMMIDAPSHPLETRTVQDAANESSARHSPRSTRTAGTKRSRDNMSEGEETTTSMTSNKKLRRTRPKRKASENNTPEYKGECEMAFTKRKRYNFGSTKVARHIDEDDLCQCFEKLTLGKSTNELVDDLCHDMGAMRLEEKEYLEGLENICQGMEKLEISFDICKHMKNLSLQ